MPNKEVDQEQLALGLGAPYEPPKTLMDFYKKDFMGTVEVLRKIFLPINNEKHWYLLVVDMSKQQLILLDSKPDRKRSMWRRLYVQKMAIFLQEMLMDPSFYDSTTYNTPLISNFTLIEPDYIGEQRDGTDCGIWVAHWMTDCVMFDYYKISVLPKSRMCIAIDLVLSPYNKKKEEVVPKAVQNWEDLKTKRKNLVKKGLED
ncbi:hypothetical protein RIF29_35091 [Crotalaria pallida]|uniref:Ubiquitin-like protease family profile domain-containing protein n=1 Tax=Crotalaria pallida TaxID=3830 RepID=A0AAN9EAS4_CROPI